MLGSVAGRETELNMLQVWKAEFPISRTPSSMISSTGWLTEKEYPLAY